MPVTAPCVSILVPTYNRRELLVEALDSIAHQSCDDYEVIVIDDGSTDDTAQLFDPPRPQTRYLCEPHNAGPAAARNLGLNEASGRYVTFLDSDDLWRPDFLQRFLSFFKANPQLMIAYCRMDNVDQNGNATTGNQRRCYTGKITESLFCSTFIHTPSVMARREILTEADGFDTSLPVVEDYNLWLRLSLKHDFGFIDEALSLRRRHGGSLSRHHRCRNLTVRAKMLEGFYANPEAQRSIKPDRARARLSHVFTAAAAAHFKARRFKEARQLARRAIHYQSHPTRSYALAALSTLLIPFSREEGIAADERR